jgi:hypothetical protein
MNNSDNHCYIFKHIRKSAANSLGTTVGFQYFSKEHIFQPGLPLVEVCKNQELRGKCHWYRTGE